MLPYNTGKYHVTPEGIPMLHTVDHSLTETMLSLSPSSQFMYEPEVLESPSCGGQSQRSAGPPTRERHSGEDFQKSEGIISPTVEGMTFEDYVDPEELFSPPVDGLAFNDCLQLNQNSTVSTPGLMFGEGVEQDGAFYESGKGLEFDDCKKLEQAFATSLDNMSYNGDQKASEGFDMLSDGMVFENRDRLDSLIPFTSEVGSLGVEGIGNDWFELDKDIYAMSKDTDILLQDPVFSGGPTLTQLNGKDFDSSCLDDYNILEDLYAKTFPLEKQQMEPSANIDLATIISKFPIGISGVVGAVTSPKFTTCTVTSFVTSVSPSSVPPQQYPTYIANEIMANQDLCYLRNSIPNQWASLFATKSPTTTTTRANPCFVPVLRNESQVVDGLIGTIVVTDGAVSLMVPEEPADASLKPMDKGDALKNNSDEDWEEIGCLLRGQDVREQMGTQNTDGIKGRLRLKVEPQDVTFNSPEELTDKESILEDSDVENADIDNSDEESFLEKSDDLDDSNASSRNEKKYFWQYNTQSKGPKGKRLCKSVETEDPHVLHDFEDPVFDPEQNQTRYKHNGKARRGDGNDVTPNPHKLYVTGNELKKLNRLINGIMPSSEMPASTRAKLLKEKNKYASRACRLKKKAQHEANKLKLHGLELEHRQLMKILVTIKKEVANRVRHRDGLVKESLSSKLDSLINKHLAVNVAGQTADYVNSVLQKVATGDRTGGVTLDD